MSNGKILTFSAIACDKLSRDEGICEDDDGDFLNGIKAHTCHKRRPRKDG